MKNKFQKAFKRVLCVVLSVAMFISFALNAWAVGASIEKQYIKDIKLIYAESKSEAESYVPNGYKLLEYDLNEGTEYVFDVYQVYIDEPMLYCFVVVFCVFFVGSTCTRH